MLMCAGYQWLDSAKKFITCYLCFACRRAAAYDCCSMPFHHWTGCTLHSWQDGRIMDKGQIHLQPWPLTPLIEVITSPYSAGEEVTLGVLMALTAALSSFAARDVWCLLTVLAKLEDSSTRLQGPATSAKSYKSTLSTPCALLTLSQCCHDSSNDRISTSCNHLWQYDCMGMNEVS